MQFFIFIFLVSHQEKTRIEFYFGQVNPSSIQALVRIPMAFDLLLTGLLIHESFPMNRNVVLFMWLFKMQDAAHIFLNQMLLFSSSFSLIICSSRNFFLFLLIFISLIILFQGMEIFQLGEIIARSLFSIYSMEFLQGSQGSGDLRFLCFVPS